MAVSLRAEVDGSPNWDGNAPKYSIFYLGSSFWPIKNDNWNSRLVLQQNNFLLRQQRIPSLQSQLGKQSKIMDAKEQTVIIPIFTLKSINYNELYLVLILYWFSFPSKCKKISGHITTISTHLTRLLIGSPTIKNTYLLIANFHSSLKMEELRDMSSSLMPKPWKKGWLILKKTFLWKSMLEPSGIEFLKKNQMAKL